MDEEEEEKILKLLEEKKAIHYTELTEILKLGVESCRHRCIEFANKYPKNTEYKKGILILKKPFSIEDLPLERRLEALQITIKTKEELEKKLKENHLPHLEKAILNGNLEKIKQEYNELKKLLGL